MRSSVEKTRKTHLYPIYLILTDRCSRLTYARLCIPTVLSVCLLSPRPFLTSTSTVPLPYPLCIYPLTPLLTAMYPSCSPHHPRLLVEPLAFGSNSPLFSLRLDDTGPRRPIRLCPYVVRTHVRFRSRVWTRRCPYLCLLYIPRSRSHRSSSYIMYVSVRARSPPPNRRRGDRKSVV